MQEPVRRIVEGGPERRAGALDEDVEQRRGHALGAEAAGRWRSRMRIARRPSRRAVRPRHGPGRWSFWTGRRPGLPCPRDQLRRDAPGSSPSARTCATGRGRSRPLPSADRGPVGRDRRHRRTRPARAARLDDLTRTLERDHVLPARSGELALIARARRSAATALAAGALLVALLAPGTALGATTLTPVATGLELAGPRHQRRRRLGPPVRRRAGRQDPGRQERRRCCRPRSSTSERDRDGRRAGPARPRVPPDVRDERQVLRQLHADATATRSSTSTSVSTANPDVADPGDRRGGSSRSPSRTRTTTAAARLRAGRLPVHRDGRRRQRRRPGQPRPEPGLAPRARCCGSTSTAPSAARSYRIPASNPCVGKPGRDEIWSRGLRNPWRFSFDRVDGDLWIGDVGQGRYEEIDRSAPPSPAASAAAPTTAGACSRARHCYRPSIGLQHDRPRRCRCVEYTHADGRAR